MDLALLKAVSRSFYLSMVWLPPAMRRGIALGYMLARATDSVADTSAAAPEIRAEVLKQMGMAVAGELPPLELQQLLSRLAGEMAEAQDKASEATLLRRFDECLALLNQLPVVEKQLVQKVLGVIVSGQFWDLSYFNGRTTVCSDEETQRYTYMVAGCVGEFWTDLGIETLGNRFCDPERRDVMVQAGIRYGRGLQLVNILRDQQEDAARGRAYLCSDAGLWIRRAERYLADGVDYARRLGMFRLRFTAMLPALLGLKTLRLIAQRTGNERVKITRGAVYSAMLNASWLSAWKRVS